MSGRHHRDRRHRSRRPSYTVWVSEVNSYVIFRSRGEHQRAQNDGSLVDFIDDFNAGRITGEPVGRLVNRPTQPNAGMDVDMYRQLVGVLRDQRADMARMNEQIADIHRDLHLDVDGGHEVGGEPEQAPR